MLKEIKITPVSQERVKLLNEKRVLDFVEKLLPWARLWTAVGYVQLHQERVCLVLLSTVAMGCGHESVSESPALPGAKTWVFQETVEESEVTESLNVMGLGLCTGI